LLSQESSGARNDTQGGEMKKKLTILLLTMILCLPTLSTAETITLKSGQEIEGKIIEKTDKYLKVDFQGVTITYFNDEIERVDSNTTVMPLLNRQVYKQPIVKLVSEGNIIPYEDWIKSKEIKDYLDRAQAINTNVQQTVSQIQGNDISEISAKVSAYINDLKALNPPAEFRNYHNKVIEPMGYTKMLCDGNMAPGSFKYMRMSMTSTIEST